MFAEKGIACFIDFFIFYFYFVCVERNATHPVSPSRNVLRRGEDELQPVRYRLYGQDVCCRNKRIIM